MQHEIEQYISVILNEWIPLRASLREDTVALLSQIAESESENLTGKFYDSMLKDPDTATHLSYELVQVQLSRSLIKWLKAVLCVKTDELEPLAKQQYHIGGVHARIGIPIQFVQRGSRQIKYGIYQYLKEYDADRAVIFEVKHYSSMAIDMAIELMSHAYAMSHHRATQNEESYRLHVLMNNSDLEQGKQQAALSSWENGVMYDLISGARKTESLISLSSSGFGLWFRHKCVKNFGEDRKVSEIRQFIEAIDRELLAVDAGVELEVKQTQELLRVIHSNCQQIHMNLEMLFSDAANMKDGKDALTNLLNKRYLPTILKHEVSLAIENKLPLSVAIIDADYFKKINDKWGHPVGDRALMHIAGLLGDNIRSSDYLFRYGGEEFLLILVEAGEFDARTSLERIRRTITSTPFEVLPGETIQITVSIGYAIHNGHPDYNLLLNNADAALYAAKRNGRNRIERF